MLSENEDDEGMVTGHSIAVSAHMLEPQVPIVGIQHISNIDSFDREAHELAAKILPPYIRDERQHLQNRLSKLSAKARMLNKVGSQPKFNVNVKTRNEPIQAFPQQMHYQSVTNFMLPGGIRVLGSRIIENSGPRNRQVFKTTGQGLRPSSVLKSKRGSM